MTQPTSGDEPGKEPDLVIARKLHSGDSETIDRVTRDNNQRLVRAAWAVLDDKPAAEAFVATCYMRAFNEIKYYSGVPSLSVWLTRFVVSSLLRRRPNSPAKPEIRCSSDLFQEPENTVVNGPFAGANGEDYKAQLSNKMLQAVSRIEPDFRIVLVLHDIELFSIDEVRYVLDIDKPTAKTRLFRGREALRDTIQREFRILVRDALEVSDGESSALTEVIKETVDLSKARASGVSGLLSGVTGLFARS